MCKRIRVLSLLVCICLLVALLNPVSVYASEQSVDSRRYDNLPGDVVLFYLEGMPIYKSDIDENFVVKENVVKRVESGSNVLDGNGYTSNYRTIPSKYSNAIVRTTTTAPRYSQTNTMYYFTAREGALFASDLSTGTFDSLVSRIVGYIPVIGDAVSLVMDFSAMYKNDIASRIRERTDYQKKVKVTETRSNYGIFYAVFDWSGRKIETTRNYVNGNKDTLNNIQYK